MIKRKLSFWTKYIIAWIIVLVAYLFNSLAMIPALILALEYIYRRFLTDNININTKGE